MEETFYKISESELRALLTASHKLDVLERDGVDNWSWYMEGLNDYLRECAETMHLSGDWDDLSFEDIVEYELTLYDEVKENENV